MHYYNTHTTHISACVRSNIVGERGKREREGEREGGREGGREREREGEREGGRESKTWTHPWCVQGLPGAVSNLS